MALSKKWDELCQLIVRTNLQNLDYSTAEMLDHLGQLILDFDKDEKNKNLCDEIKSELKKLNKVVYSPALQNRVEILKVFHNFFSLFTEKTSYQNPTTFDDFPPEILMDFAQNLPPEDLMSLSGVNKKLQAVVNDSKIWERLSKSYFFAAPEAQTPPQGTNTTWKEHFKEQYISRHNLTWTRPPISRGTRRIFSLVHNNDLDGLKAQSHLITVESLYELDRNTVSYLYHARENGNDFCTFIIDTVQAKANTPYLKQKLSVALRHARFAMQPIAMDNYLEYFFDQFQYSPIFRIDNWEKCFELFYYYYDYQALELLIAQAKEPAQLYLLNKIVNEYNKENAPLNEQGLMQKISVRGLRHLLKYAVTHRNLFVVQKIIAIFLIKSLSINDDLLLTALKIKNNTPIVKCLLENKEKLRLVIRHDKALNAAMKSEFEYVKLLVEAGATFPPSNPINSLGCLENLVCVEDEKQISEILTYFNSKFKFDIDNLRNDNNQTLLDLAFSHPNLALVKRLLTSSVINIQDKHGCSPLHTYLLQVGERALKADVQLLYLMLRLGADPRISGKDKPPPVTLCETQQDLFFKKALQAFEAQKHFNACIEELMKLAFNPRNLDENMQCAINNDLELTRLLLQDQIVSNKLPTEEKNLLQKSFDKYFSNRKENIFCEDIELREKSLTMY